MTEVIKRDYLFILLQLYVLAQLPFVTKIGPD